MDFDQFIKRKEVKCKIQTIFLEVALSLNKELFDDKKISYKMFKSTENSILKEKTDHKNTIKQ